MVWDVGISEQARVVAEKSAYTSERSRVLWPQLTGGISPGPATSTSAAIPGNDISQQAPACRGSSSAQEGRSGVGRAGKAVQGPPPGGTLLLSVRKSGYHAYRR